MIELDTYSFHLGQSQYKSISARGWFFFAALVVVAVSALVLSSVLWKAYTHTFTLYLKWQDALVALLWFIAFITLGGSTFVLRFQYALHKGYTEGMISLQDKGNDRLIVRDLSSENLVSIFWVMNSAFWCFVTVLVGLLPVILIGWTMKIPLAALAFLATGISILLSLAGVVVSMIAAFFIVVGCIGAISLCRKMGSSHIYTWGDQTTLRIDHFVLTIIYPGRPESMMDLNLLDVGDQRKLLSLLYKRWRDAEQRWNPALGEEIEQALVETERSMILV